MIAYWETAPTTRAPIVAFLCYKAHLSVFDREKVKSYLPHVERLPYTASMLDMRASRGASLPDWYPVAQLAVIEGDGVTVGMEQKPAA